jgi:septum formation protein
MMQTDMIKGREIVLASASPRRRELIAQLNLPVRQAAIKNVDESYPTTLPPHEVAAYISRKKAQAYANELSEHEILVTADTVVICKGKVLGKPADAAEATDMLHTLSGKTHIVVTGVTVATTVQTITFSDTTEVDFVALTDDEIQFYIDQYRPFDKAGAYGIQEWIGYIGIRAIRGDYYNVMGLPLCALYATLKQLR